MKRLKFYVDEWYPYYGLIEGDGNVDTSGQFSDEEVERIKKCQEEFRAVQNLIGERC